MQNKYCNCWLKINMPLMTIYYLAALIETSILLGMTILPDLSANSIQEESCMKVKVIR